MILTGQDILDRKLVLDAIDSRVQAQMCGFDLTVAKVERFINSGTIDFDNSRRLLPYMEEVPLTTTRGGLEFWELPRGAYLVTYNETVQIPSDCAAIARPRSTLLRSGATMETALWDPGYAGKSQSMLVVHANMLRLFKNARVAQLVFVELGKSAETLYSGVYQGEGVVR